MAPRVLVLDDDEDNLLILGEALRGVGLDVASAATCAEAREILERTPCDLLVADRQLADGNALDFVRTLGAARPRASVLVTGFGQPEDLAASKAAGFDAHLVKPVRLDVLERTIASVLSGATSSARVQEKQAHPQPPSPR